MAIYREMPDSGRWLLFAMGGYMLWITASQWIGALAWRIRPPEPF